MDDAMRQRDSSKVAKMGSGGNSNSSRLATLQDRKKTIEETLAKHNKELRKLCIQEAELTGVMPTEYPLEPGETPPVFRRTAFQLPQNLINNLNKEEEINDLEMEMQVLAKMAEAALGLANENNGNKTVRRTHMANYQQHKQRYNELEEKLHYLKTKVNLTQTHAVAEPKVATPQPQQQSQPKQRKKPRPADQDTTSNFEYSEPFGKTALRHSLRSLQRPATVQDVTENRYSMQMHQKLMYRGSDTTSLGDNPHFQYQDDAFQNFSRMTLNGYHDFPERSELLDSHQFVHVSPSYVHKPYASPSHTLPHAARRSPQQHHHPQEYYKYASGPVSPNGYYRQSVASQKYMHKPYPSEPEMNPHQIQPHQQYEHNLMTSGLGGYWKQNLTGEMVWCNTVDESVSHKDKRFGSLDRRKNKRVQKRLSPNVDPKSATLAIVPANHEQGRVISSRYPQVVRQRPDHRQLVRTQSLGSVGVHAVDSIGPSDESCSGSEHSGHNDNIRRHKQKEWYETSLDGPTSNTVPAVIRSRPNIPSIAPEDKYSDFPPPPPPHVPAQNSPPMSSPHMLAPHIPAVLAPSPHPSSHMPSQHVPSQHVTSQHVPPQHVPPQHVPAQHVTSQHVPPQHVPPQHALLQHVPSQHASLQLVPPQHVSPQHVPSQLVSPQHAPLQLVPPQHVPSQHMSPQHVPSQHVSPQHVPPQHAPPPHVPSPQSPQMPKVLEIPAESNPSPRAHEAKLEMFNNNIPKNGTVVQQALWKPYHEETKPFEMSDFYKYSTKFKKSPQKPRVREDSLSDRTGFQNLPSPSISSNGNDEREDDNVGVIQKSVYRPLQPMKCRAFGGAVDNRSPDDSVEQNNTSIDIDVAENFSAEMNAWYQNHDHRTENNNATLV